jgi:hypothetical protein
MVLHRPVELAGHYRQFGIASEVSRPIATVISHKTTNWMVRRLIYLHEQVDRGGSF